MSKAVLPAVIAATVIAVCPAAAEMRLTSPDIGDEQRLDAAQVLMGFGCEGGNLAPALSWSGAPEGTGSFIVTAYDPDAPTGSGFWHWSVFDIPATVTALPEGAGSDGVPLPEGAVPARNDFSRNGFDGACPPQGRTHRYVFTVYAMPQDKLPLDATASGALVGFFANTANIEAATITAVFGR